MADVFISYAHRNRSRIVPISTNVEQAGLSLWWDKRLMPGDDFTLVIERELEAAKCVVVAWSEAARDSLWVRAEATEALDAGKIVQVRLDGVKPPLPFTVVEMLDLTRWRGDRAEPPWPKLESTARALAGGRVQAVDSLAFGGPALQDMGSTAALGWLSRTHIGPPVWFGPDGAGQTQPGTILESAPLGALIGRVGNVTFVIGAGGSTTAPASGSIHLSMNDTPNEFGNNQGMMEVSID